MRKNHKRKQLNIETCLAHHRAESLSLSLSHFRSLFLCISISMRMFCWVLPLKHPVSLTYFPARTFCARICFKRVLFRTHTSFNHTFRATSIHTRTSSVTYVNKSVCNRKEGVKNVLLWLRRLCALCVDFYLFQSRKLWTQTVR